MLDYWSKGAYGSRVSWMLHYIYTTEYREQAWFKTIEGSTSMSKIDLLNDRHMGFESLHEHKETASPGALNEHSE